MFAFDKSHQASLVFVGKAGAYPTVEQFKLFSLGKVPSLSYKHWTRLERLVRTNTLAYYEKS